MSQFCCSHLANPATTRHGWWPDAASRNSNNGEKLTGGREVPGGLLLVAFHNLGMGITIQLLQIGCEFLMKLCSGGLYYFSFIVLK